MLKLKLNNNLMYTFIGIERLIILDSEVVSFAVADLYSRWKNWSSLSANSKWLDAFRSTGGDPIGGDQFISPYYVLLNGWKIRPHESDHLLTVIGNLITDDASNSFVTTLGDYNVQIQSIVTSNSLTTNTAAAIGGGLTLEEHQKLMEVLTLRNYLENKE